LNNFKNSFGLAQDVVIPKAKHLNTSSFEISGSPFVVKTLLVLVMLTAINFDRQLCFMAIEIHDVWTDWVLTSELETTHPSIPQVGPKSLFGIGKMMS
jgi:(p)ppGpp synthase/HD superfamily hydrolase